MGCFATRACDAIQNGKNSRHLGQSNSQLKFKKNCKNQTRYLLGEKHSFLLDERAEMCIVSGFF